MDRTFGLVRDLLTKQRDRRFGAREPGQQRIGRQRHGVARLTSRISNVRWALRTEPSRGETGGEGKEQTEVETGVETPGDCREEHDDEAARW